MDKKEFSYLISRGCKTHYPLQGKSVGKQNIKLTLEFTSSFLFCFVFLQKNPEKPYVIIIPALNTCTAKYLTVWLALIYVYKGILLLYGLFLAYETRNVVYAHLNDSRVIGICVYNVVVLSTIGAFLGLILNNEQYEQLYAAISVCIIFPATTTISLIFFPKVK